MTCQSFLQLVAPPCLAPCPCTPPRVCGEDYLTLPTFSPYLPSSGLLLCAHRVWDFCSLTLPESLSGKQRITQVAAECQSVTQVLPHKPQRSELCIAPPRRNRRPSRSTSRSRKQPIAAGEREEGPLPLAPPVRLSSRRDESARTGRRRRRSAARSTECGTYKTNAELKKKHTARKRSA